MRHREHVRMVATVRVRSTHPWIKVDSVVCAWDTVGIDERGEPARVDRDVIVTAIVPSPDGVKLVRVRDLQNFTRS